MPREGYGKKDSTQKGRKQGGRGRNQTGNCRHPIVSKKRR